MGNQKLVRSLILLYKSRGPPQGGRTLKEHTFCSTTAQVGGRALPSARAWAWEGAARAQQEHEAVRVGGGLNLRSDLTSAVPPIKAE